MKDSIAYFSRAGNNYVGGRIKDLSVGNTEVAAKMIQEAHAWRHIQDRHRRGLPRGLQRDHQRGAAGWGTAKATSRGFAPEPRFSRGSLSRAEAFRAREKISWLGLRDWVKSTNVASPAKHAQKPSAAFSRTMSTTSSSSPAMPMDLSLAHQRVMRPQAARSLRAWYGSRRARSIGMAPPRPRP